MSIYVGIDLHRKRSQVAVMKSDGGERVNRDGGNDSPELIELLASLLAGTPVAFEAVYGCSWLLKLELLSCDLQKVSFGRGFLDEDSPEVRCICAEPVREDLGGLRWPIHPPRLWATTA